MHTCASLLLLIVICTHPHAKVFPLNNVSTYICTCTYIYVYIYIYTCIYTNIHTCIHACASQPLITCTRPHAEAFRLDYINTYIHTHIHIYKYMYTYIHTYRHTYIYTCASQHLVIIFTRPRAQVFRPNYINTYIHTYIHTYRHIYIHT